MSPEVATIPLDATVGEALAKAKPRALEAETIYTLSVVNDTRLLMGIVGLRDLLAAEETSRVASLMVQADTALVTEPAEDAARRCSEFGHLALPVVDHEDRLVGILTVDDALVILKQADSEDQARMSGTEPIRGHYPATSVGTLVRSRVVWLLVLSCSSRYSSARAAIPATMPPPLLPVHWRWVRFGGATGSGFSDVRQPSAPCSASHSVPWASSSRD